MNQTAEKKHPAIFGEKIPEALRITKEWVASMEWSMSMCLTLPEPDKVIAALSALSGGVTDRPKVIDDGAIYRVEALLREFLQLQKISAECVATRRAT